MLTALLAATPIALILIAMIFLKRSAAQAGLAGLVLTLLLALFHFSFQNLPDQAPLWHGVTGSLAEAGFTALTILWIIFGALCLHQLQVATNAIATLRDGIATLSDDPRIVAILIAWFFAIFLEGAAGFGAPIALAAPFLVGFGFRPLQAVTVVLIGHCVGVSFGAVGTPLMAQVGITGFDGRAIAAVTADFHLILGTVMLVLTLLVVSRDRLTADRPFRSILPWIAIAAPGFLVPMWLIARFVGPELPTMGGAVIGAFLFILALRLFHRVPDRASLEQSSDDNDDALQRPSAGEILRACSPYAIVITLILLTRMIPALREPLSSITWSWELFGTFKGSFAPLYHPGTLLVLGFFLGARAQGATRDQLLRALKAALKMLVPVTIALVAMLAISRLMVHAAMIEALAEAASQTGAIWPLLAPWVGVLGSFVTGSATASNILFTDFQVATAERLSLDPLRLVGVQGFGAAVGNIICPHNIIAGCATVGLMGREGEVLKRTLGACALYATLGGVMALILL